MLNMNEVRRIVVKVGSSTLTYDNGKPNIRRIERLVRHDQRPAEPRLRDGARILGCGGGRHSKARAWRRDRRSCRSSQAAAAVGQCELMHIYDKMFLEYGINVAQILLSAREYRR